jgi:polar amino acid transport system permease protein
MNRLLDQFFNSTIWWRHWDELVRGFGLTILLAIAIILTGLVLGLALGLIRIARPRPVQWGVIIFADVFRAVPPLMILVVIYFALPFAGIRISGFAAAWIGLSLVLAAFVEEIIHGGLLAVDKGQWEAPRSTGVGNLATLLIFIFPQAIRMTVAPLTNRTIAIVKNTALGSVIAVPEILNVAMSALSSSANSTPLTMAALFYLVLFAPLVIFSRWLEHRFPQRR